MKNAELAHRMPPASGSSAGDVVGRRRRLRDADRADLELGNLRDRIDRADRAVVRRPCRAASDRDEHRVGADRLHHLRAHDDRAAPALDPHEVAVGDAERLGQARVHLAHAAAGTDRRARRCAGSACRRDTATRPGRSSARSDTPRPAPPPPAATRPAGSAPCRRDGRTARPRTGAACRDDPATGTARRRPSRGRSAPR